MPEHLQEIANFAAGIRDVPAFERGQGASKMVNYLVDYDGEVVPRPGYTELDTTSSRVLHIHTDGSIQALDASNLADGPFVYLGHADDLPTFVRFHEGTHYVHTKERLFFTHRDSGIAITQKEGYWLDLENVDITGTDSEIEDHIYQWTFDPSEYQANIADPGDDEEYIDLNPRPGEHTQLNPDLDPRTDNTDTSDDLTARTITPVPVLTGSTGNRSRISHPLMFGVGADPPGVHNRIVVYIGYYEKGVNQSQSDTARRLYSLRVRFGTNDEATWWAFVFGSAGVALDALHAQDEDWYEPIIYHAGKSLNSKERYYRDIVKGQIPGIDESFTPDGEAARDKHYVFRFEWDGSDITKRIYDAGGDVDDIDAEKVTFVIPEQYERTYFQIETTFADADGGDQETEKYRYPLVGMRQQDLGSEIASGLVTGASLAAQGAAIAGPYGAAAGAAVGVAQAGVAAARAILPGPQEFPLSRLNTPMTPSPTVGGGFQPGIYLSCFTYSLDKERTVETMPSRVTATHVFDYIGAQSKTETDRTPQALRFDINSDALRDDLVQTARYNWLRSGPRSEPANLLESPSYINIYAARTSDFTSDQKTVAETGLEYILVARHRADGAYSGDTSVTWTDEKPLPPQSFLESQDHDPPFIDMKQITAYGSRIWGVSRSDNTIRYSKLGPYGYHFFPYSNTLVPQSIALDRSSAPIVHLHPAPNDSMLYVFKSDTIHFLRGHGEIRGLHTPETPVDIDIDASSRKENVGTSYPRTVSTVKDMVLFIGSDKILYQLSGTQVRPFSISIQPHIEKYDDDPGLPDLTADNVFAFEYRNCYHLCLPEETLVLDLQKGYWTLFDWQIRYHYWHQDVNDALYAYIESTDEMRNTSEKLVQLYKGTDGLPTFCEWESNPMKVPYQSVISGVHVYHDGSATGEIEVAMRVNNTKDGSYDFVRHYTPAAYNRFRQGFHSRGHRVQVRVKDENPTKLRIDRIAVETTRYG